MSAAEHTLAEALAAPLDPAIAPVVDLAANAYYVTAADETISTVLGSCIAVCLRDPAIGVGGVNHFMLPTAAGRSLTGKPAALRYGPNAMNALLAALYTAGAVHERLEAKIFGGARVLAGPSASRIGAANIAFAIDDLAKRGVSLIAQDVGGEWPRRLYYRPATGEARIRRFQRVLPHAFDPATGAWALPRTVNTSFDTPPAANGVPR